MFLFSYKLILDPPSGEARSKQPITDIKSYITVTNKEYSKKPLESSSRRADVGMKQANTGTRGGRNASTQTYTRPKQPRTGVIAPTIWTNKEHSKKPTKPNNKRQDVESKQTKADNRAGTDGNKQINDSTKQADTVTTMSEKVDDDHSQIDPLWIYIYVISPITILVIIVYLLLRCEFHYTDKLIGYLQR